MRLAHRVHTAATPAQVWEVLGDPQRWPDFELFLRRVRGAHGRASTGQRLTGVARIASLGVPIDVLEAVPPSRLVLLIHTAPGLREQITVEVTPALRGGCDLTVSVVVEGLLARVAVAPLYVRSGVTARRLGLRADQVARIAA